MIALFLILVVAETQNTVQKMRIPSTWESVQSSRFDSVWNQPGTDLSKRWTEVYALGTSSVLVAENFGFEVPEGGQIENIKATFVAKTNSTSEIDAVIGTLVQLKKMGGALFSTRVIKTPLTPEGTSINYPLSGEDPLWGGAWNPQDVNSNQFGIRLQVSASHRDMEVLVEKVYVTIDYKNPVENLTPSINKDIHPTKVGVIIGLALIGVFVMSILICGCAAVLKGRLSSRESEEEQTHPFTGEKLEPIQMKSFSLQNVTPINTEITIGEIIHESPTSIIHKGRIVEEKKTVLVACKITKRKPDFLKHEQQMLFTLAHPNVVSTPGIQEVADPDEIHPVFHPFLVMEYADKGTLKTYIAKESTSLQLAHQLSLAIHIGLGLSHIHNKGVIHRRLTSTNLLVDRNNTVKLADFACACFIQKNKKHAFGSEFVDSEIPDDFVKWLAPECIKEKRYTRSSDIWAFGMILFEIFTRGEDPWPDLDVQNTKKAITRGATLEFSSDSNIPSGVVDLFKAMTKYVPAERPSAVNVLSSLRKLLSGVNSINIRDTKWDKQELFLNVELPE